MLTHTIVGSPIGALTLVNRDGVLGGLWMGSRWLARGVPIGERDATGFERVVVPCHRVIGGDGSLTGYGGGLERKRFLLDLEVSVTGSPLF